MMCLVERGRYLSTHSKFAAPTVYQKKPTLSTTHIHTVSMHDNLEWVWPQRKKKNKKKNMDEQKSCDLAV